jgi:polar amino acid transport system substrate-binding protein
MALALTTVLSFGLSGPGRAQVSGRSPSSEAGNTVLAPTGGPSAGDTQRRVVLRFVTESDFPPFNYLDGEGALTGFNVDLARAICLEVNAACDIKVRPWDELMTGVAAGEADAAIGALRITWNGVAKLEFSDRYFHTPGHFAGKKDGLVVDITPEALEGKSVGVAKGTAHEAYLKSFFHDSAVKTFENIDAARDALADGRIAFLFDDAIGLSFWVNGTNSRQCCELKGGAFLEPKYFGDGLAIGLPKGDRQLKVLIDAALARVRESGRFEELLQRYFPTRIY